MVLKLHVLIQAAPEMNSKSEKHWEPDFNMLITILTSLDKFLTIFDRFFGRQLDICQFNHIEKVLTLLKWTSR